MLNYIVTVVNKSSTFLSQKNRAKLGAGKYYNYAKHSGDTGKIDAH